MDNPFHRTKDHRLAVGLLVGAAIGAAVGAGLMAWLAPRATSELKEKMAAKAKDVRKQASDRLEEASNRVNEVMEELTKKERV